MLTRTKIELLVNNIFNVIHAKELTDRVMLQRVLFTSLSEQRMLFVPEINIGNKQKLLRHGNLFHLALCLIINDFKCLQQKTVFLLF